MWLLEEMSNDPMFHAHQIWKTHQFCWRVTKARSSLSNFQTTALVLPAPDSTTRFCCGKPLATMTISQTSKVTKELLWKVILNNLKIFIDFYRFSAFFNRQSPLVLVLYRQNSSHLGYGRRNMSSQIRQSHSNCQFCTSSKTWSNIVRQWFGWRNNSHSRLVTVYINLL